MPSKFSTRATSTRVIRPQSFKTGVVKKQTNERPPRLPTSQRFNKDRQDFQDIGARLVRPQNRKAETWLARKKGLSTSQGLEQRLTKEQGIKIRLGDKTLEELLQVTVPDKQKQEYIKDDGSIDVREVPVLDSVGNPIMVKKKLNIPGTIQYFQQSTNEKIDDIKKILADSTKSANEKMEVITLLAMNILMNPEFHRAPLKKEFADIISKMPSYPDNIELTGFPDFEYLIDGHIADKRYITEHLPWVQLYLINKSRLRGMDPTKPLKVESRFIARDGTEKTKISYVDFEDIQNLDDDDGIDLATSTADKLDDLIHIKEPKPIELSEEIPPLLTEEGEPVESSEEEKKHDTGPEEEYYIPEAVKISLTRGELKTLTDAKIKPFNKDGKIIISNTHKGYLNRLFGQGEPLSSNQYQSVLRALDILNPTSDLMNVIELLNDFDFIMGTGNRTGIVGSGLRSRSFGFVNPRITIGNWTYFI